MAEDPVHQTEEAMSAGPGQALAVGLYIGAIVLLIGLIIAIYGAVGGTPRQQDGSDINKNLWWGLFMILVGVVTLALSYWSPRRRGAR